MNTKQHWESIYTTQQPHEVSWTQAEAGLSLELIAQVAPQRTARIVDVGGGASCLVDALLNCRYSDVTVNDISAAAMQRAQTRLGANAHKVNWVVADITQPNGALPAQADVWHDRAVFHFLTKTTERGAYLQTVRDTVKVGGHVVIATFALDGPPRGSNLDVRRYGAPELCDEFGDDFELMDTMREIHQTPWRSEQPFTYCVFKRNKGPSHPFLYREGTKERRYREVKSLRISVSSAPPR